MNIGYSIPRIGWRLADRKRYDKQQAVPDISPARQEPESDPAEPAGEPALLTAEEVGRQIGWPPDTVWWFATKLDRIAYTRAPSGALRFTQAAVNEYVSKHGKAGQWHES
jgi:hypothetical protein